MTLDEFKKNIVPHMKKGYVAMDRDLTFKFFKYKPKRKEKVIVLTMDKNNER